jgi:hypothetical protein
MTDTVVPTPSGRREARDLYGFLKYKSAQQIAREEMMNSEMSHTETPGQNGLE